MRFSRRVLSRRAFVLAAPFAAGAIMGSLSGCGNDQAGQGGREPAGQERDARVETASGIALDHEIDLGLVLFRVPSYAANGDHDPGYGKKGSCTLRAGDQSTIELSWNMKRTFHVSSSMGVDGRFELLNMFDHSDFAREPERRTVEGTDHDDVLIYDMELVGGGKEPPFQTVVFVEKAPGRWGCIRFASAEQTKSSRNLIDDVIRSISVFDFDPAGDLEVPESLEDFGITAWTMRYYEPTIGFDAALKICQGTIDKLQLEGDAALKISQDAIGKLQLEGDVTSLLHLAQVDVASGGQVLLSDGSSLPLYGQTALFFAVLSNVNEGGGWTRQQIESLLALCGVGGVDFDQQEEVFSPTEHEEVVATGTYDLDGYGVICQWVFMATGDIVLVSVF